MVLARIFMFTIFFLRRKVLAILRNVALRLYFKQSNTGLFTFPLKHYKLMIVLPMDNIAGTQTFVVTLYAVLRDEATLEKTLQKFVESLGASVDEFKFTMLQGKDNRILDISKCYAVDGTAHTYKID